MGRELEKTANPESVPEKTLKESDTGIQESEASKTDEDRGFDNTEIKAEELAREETESREDASHSPEKDPKTGEKDPDNADRAGRETEEVIAEAEETAEDIEPDDDVVAGEDVEPADDGEGGEESEAVDDVVAADDGEATDETEAVDDVLAADDGEGSDETEAADDIKAADDIDDVPEIIDSEALISADTVESIGEAEPYIPAIDQASDFDSTALFIIAIIIFGALFLVYAFRRQSQRRQKEIEETGKAEEALIGDEALTDHPPSEPIEKDPASPALSPVISDDPLEAERTAKEKEKERRRQEFLDRQRAAHLEASEKEARRLEIEKARKEEEDRLAEEKRLEEEEREKARIAALTASSGPLTDRLAGTRKGLAGKIGSLLGKRIDENTLEELEEILFTADIGVQTAGNLLETVRDSLRKKELAEPEKIMAALKKQIAAILCSETDETDETDETGFLFKDTDKRPFVIMVIGVNGVGKTTTIGKLAARYTAGGKKVILAAADTFRAAAVEQLQIWSERAGCEMVRGADGADPGSVTFNAVRKGIDENADIVIVDTAGRLHTKVPLMEELAKVNRVLGKARNGAPDEILLVVDATTGQNALQQARMFKEIIPVTSIALTKLDGTAKGGVIIGIKGELDIPVRFIGVGEQAGDLRPFNPEEFVDALFPEESTSKQ